MKDEYDFNNAKRGALAFRDKKQNLRDELVLAFKNKAIARALLVEDAIAMVDAVFSNQPLMQQPDCQHGVDDGACKECHVETAWQCDNCGATTGEACNAIGCFKNEAEPAPAQDEREAFRDHLAKCAAEVATWPAWKREALGRHIAPCQRGQFETWAMETKHPVFGFIGDDWLDHGDDPDIYANDYIQGAWVMWQHLHAHDITRRAQTEQRPITVPDGYVLAPVEPTFEVRQALHNSGFEAADNLLNYAYKAVLRAVRQPVFEYRTDPRKPHELSSAGCRCVRFGEGNPHWPCPIHSAPIAQTAPPAAQDVSGLVTVPRDLLERVLSLNWSGNSEIRAKSRAELSAALSAYQAAQKDGVA